MKTLSASQINPDSSDAVFLDVRTAGEFGTVHIPGSINRPLGRLNSGEVRALAGSRTCYVVCQSGERAKTAAAKLDAEGLDVAILDGGIEAWKASGREVARGERGVLPLSRQVQTAAGVIALVGCVAGWLVNPAWFGVAAFVGFGLLAAGLTGFCPMAMLLARMPWNAGSAGRTSCEPAAQG